MEEKERIAKETSFTNLLQQNDSTKSSIIPESSDSEQDEERTRRRLCLNRKQDKLLVEKDTKQQANVSNANYSDDYNNDHVSLSNDTLLGKSKENLNDDSDLVPKSMENKHLQTPKKYSANRQKKIISDSDTDSPWSKYSIAKESPRKEWIGPDIKLNLKDLGLNKQLEQWIQSVQKKPLMSAMPVSVIQLNIITKISDVIILLFLFLSVVFRLQRIN